jgi:hypothetical protein
MLMKLTAALILHAHKCSRKDTESSQTGRQVNGSTINDVTRQSMGFNDFTIKSWGGGRKQNKVQIMFNL